MKSLERDAFGELFRRDSGSSPGALWRLYESSMGALWRPSVSSSELSGENSQRKALKDLPRTWWPFKKQPRKIARYYAVSHPESGFPSLISMASGTHKSTYAAHPKSHPAMRIYKINVTCSKKKTKPRRGKKHIFWDTPKYHPTILFYSRKYSVFDTRQATKYI